MAQIDLNYSPEKIAEQYLVDDREETEEESKIPDPTPAMEDEDDFDRPQLDEPEASGAYLDQGRNIVEMQDTITEQESIIKY
jgi:hypothetical protein